ncbi:MAG: hypothetical protein JW780_07580 [Clostridiales bacterium]|nr:hypothetical protein [Clostridiales bacterium]
MGRRDVNDFPFAYLTEEQSPNPSRRSEPGVRLGNNRSGRPGAREIEKLLIISIVLTVVFLVLLTITILVGLNRGGGEPVGETTVASAQNTEENGMSSLPEQTVTNDPGAPETQETEQTGLSVIHLG